VRARRADNEELKTALSDVQEARGKLRDRQAKKDAITARYAKRAPSLAGYIEQSARALKLEVTDSVDRPDVPVGKRYIERSTTVHLKKAGMYAIAKFLEGIEKSGNAVAVTRLGIRKRTGEPDSYDVEVGISAYDRIEKPAAPEPDKDKKP
jgi:general secretion pathway protein M